MEPGFAELAKPTGTVASSGVQADKEYFCD